MVISSCFQCLFTVDLLNDFTQSFCTIFALILPKLNDLLCFKISTDDTLEELQKRHTIKGVVGNWFVSLACRNEQCLGLLVIATTKNGS